MISGIAISVQRAENLSRWPIATHPRRKGCLRKERYSIFLLYTSETQLLTVDLLTDITSDTKTLKFRPLSYIPQSYLRVAFRPHESTYFDTYIHTYIHRYTHTYINIHFVGKATCQIT